MADKLTPERRSKNMSAIRSKDTKPEMVVRRLVHSMGFRYRLHRKDLPGKPDLVFGPGKKVIFVHGCFWHQHPDPGCKDARLPKSRIEYWVPKLEKNRQRDARNIQELKSLGFKVLVVWECEVKDIDRLSENIEGFLSQ